MRTQTYTGLLTIKTCADCGLVYGIDSDYYESLERTGATWYCPNGHRWHVAQTQEAKLRAELARTEGQLSNARYEAKLNENRRRAEKAAKTRLKNRIANGVCPCCNRHFANVQKHIENQHPEFQEP